MATNSNIIQSNAEIFTDIASILTQQNKGTVQQALSNLMQQLPIGSVANAIGNNFYGINHRQTPSAIQSNKDFFGLTFFTRPRMNFSTVNLRAERMFNSLLTGDTTSISRIIRCYLDSKIGALEHVTSPLVDDQQAFIPILTNTVLSVAGWPDVVAPTYTATAGAYKEEFGFIDGTAKIFSSYDISASFRNVPGDPITMMLLYWVYYASLVFEGVIVPYPEFIVENEIDYMCRIYRLVLDVTKTRVVGIAANGACFPMSSPIGAKFNYEHDRPINNSNDQITVSFRSYGAIYNDPKLIEQFNDTVVLFNGGMSDANRAQHYTMVPISALPIFNFKGYPRINPDGNTLEWWVDTSIYQQMLPNVNSSKLFNSVNPNGQLSSLGNNV
jgi:hypothetical protein